LSQALATVASQGKSELISRWTEVQHRADAKAPR